MMQPMLASLIDAPLEDPQFVYEPKYDGIRAIAEVTPAGARLWSRLGNDKTRQFPEVAEALKRWAARRTSPVVLDGEIVALDEKGEPAGFQKLQGRIHLSEGGGDGNVAFVVFDLLKDGARDLRERPLTERRAALEALFGRTRSPILRISRQVRGSGRALYDDAVAHGWEGLIAKHAGSLYKSGKRTPDWRKIKIVHEQEFVVGGWTEPRQTRSYFGALLLGVYADAHNATAAAGRTSNGACLQYVGHTGTGFNEHELARVMKRLLALETNASPFCEKIKTNERPHWVRPELVAQIKFTEWTADAKLRHPVYLGLRDDKKPSEVRREEVGGPAPAPAPANTTRRRRSAAQRSGDNSARAATSAAGTQALIDQLNELEHARRDGVLALPGGDTISVTNLHKVFWPKQKLTKGDLFRFYVRVAPVLLPVLNDRPLVMKRFPNGVSAKPFYQHRAPEVPSGVRTKLVEVAERRAHIIGGSLKTLIYTTQLAAISQDPWFSRVQHPQFADHVALDLDPGEGVPFGRVLDVARWIQDELETLGAVGYPKTSGADGLHVYIPLPPETPYEAGLLFCQIIATVVSQKHPRTATVERTVSARGPRVYVDYLQNILGKTLASAYSARASEYAGVSTPLSWAEVEAGVERRDFTIRTVPDRVGQVGDLWKGLLTSKGVDLSRVRRYLNRK
jgi:bifunctional non-homologous end joining protein LigD